MKTRLTDNNGINLPKNMVLSLCSDFNSNSEQKVTSDSKSRPLIVVFAWMLAKNKHLNKFRQLWLEKGFDVLTVRTSILDPLLPPIGSQIVAKNLIEVLRKLSINYNEIVIHAFSVGGYQFGEVLVQLTEDTDKNNYKILNSIKGLIMDSIVFAKDRTSGLSKTLTQNPVFQPIIEKTSFLFFNLFPQLIIKHYNNSEELIVNPPVKYSGLLKFFLLKLRKNKLYLQI